MFAVVETGGKQYRVRPGDVIDIEKIDGDVGATIVLDRVLTVGGDGAVKIGAPLVEGAKVSAKIIKQDRGAKILVMRHMARKNFRKMRGHRQWLTTVEIVSIA